MNDGMIKNYYATLNIELGASRGEIEQAYKQAAGQLEGDEAGLYSLYTSEEKRSLLNELTEAYETLSDGARKKAYDAALKSVAVGSNAAQLYEGGKDNTFADASVIDDAEMSAPQRHVQVRHALAVMGSTDRWYRNNTESSTPSEIAKGLGQGIRRNERGQGRGEIADGFEPVLSYRQGA